MFRCQERIQFVFSVFHNMISFSYRSNLDIFKILLNKIFIVHCIMDIKYF